MVAVAALLHGLALRYAPDLYGSAPAARKGGAWLLWIYALILAAGILELNSRSSLRRQGPVRSTPLDPTKGIRP